MSRRTITVVTILVFYLMLGPASGDSNTMTTPQGILNSGDDLSQAHSLRTQLDKYIETAVQNNLELSTYRLDVDRTEAERKRALAGFLPKASLESRYSRAEGGRVIDVDMNEYLAPLLPPGTEIESIEFAFLRSREQDTHFRIVQPIFTGGALLNGYAARSALKDAAGYRLQAAETNLRTRTTEVYLNYLKAVQLEKIKTGILELAQKNHRLTESLLSQGKLLENDVMRAEVNVAEAATQLAEARKQRNLARRLFNDLLRRNPNEEIRVIQVTAQEAGDFHSLEDDWKTENEDELFLFEERAYRNRGELAALQASIKAVEKMRNVAYSQYLPQASLVVDYGWQGEEFSFGKENDYYMASLILSWNIFDGGAREAGIQESRVRVADNDAKRKILQRSIGLQVEEAYLDFQTHIKQLEFARRRLESAEENHRILNRRYGLGMALPVEMNDALTQLDIARSGEVVVLCDYVIAAEKLKNVTGWKENRSPRIP